MIALVAVVLYVFAVLACSAIAIGLYRLVDVIVRMVSA